MDAPQFDALVRVVTTRNRREALIALLGGVLSLSGLYQAEAGMMSMGMMGMGKGKGPRPNEFGCLNVGQPCRGKDSTCCSGRCQGNAPRKGKRDTSRCVGHDESTCQPGQQTVFCGGGANVPCTTTTGKAGVCNITTGNASYCLRDTRCRPCQRDADCEGVCGPGAACLRCASCAQFGAGETMCAGTDTCTFT